jgi:Domain of unknown function (DUF4838)/Glycosyl hydrolase family 67 N-terminus
MRRERLWRGVAVLCLAFAAAPAWVQAAGQESISIMVPQAGDAVLKFAAQDLARYLKQVTGEPIATGDAAAPHHIYLGEAPPPASAADTKQLREEVEKLQEDGFVIRSLGPDVVILGRGSRGNLYGCYAFLERQGVRWFFPGAQYEVVPQHALDWKAPLHVSESPAFPKRILFYWPNNYSSTLDWIDFSAKVRLNRIGFHYTWPAKDWYILMQSQLLPELRKRGMEIEVGGHFLSALLPRTLFTEHPDWFRLNEQGKRSNDYNLNPFNPEALDDLASRAIPYLLKMPEASLFHLWADDIEGGGWSHEPGKDQYTPSDQALLVSNDLVKKLRAQLPNADLAYLAYHDTVDPPRVVKPEPGVIYFYAPRERCYAHALNDPQCDLNRKYAQALEHGLPAFGGARSEVFEYYADQILFMNTTNPPLPEVLTADLEYYRGLGIPAVGALMTNTSNFVTPQVNMFLYPEALWDTKRDLNGSLAEYATLYFGDPGLAAYFRALARGLADVLEICHYEHPGDAWDDVRAEKETDTALEYHVRGMQEAIGGPLARAAVTLDQAVRRAKNPTAHERLLSEQVSMDFTLRQAKLYYHLLKGEWLYRIWKNQHDQEAGLGVLTELALARHTWEGQKNFVATSDMKANPLMPNPRQLEQRAGELVRTITRDPASAVGVNISGFGSNRLDEHLMKGVGGYVLAGPTGSRAVVWTDVAASRSALRPGDSGPAWLDELGQPLKPSALDLYTSAAVVDAKAMPADKLFDVLLESQLQR